MKLFPHSFIRKKTGKEIFSKINFKSEILGCYLIFGHAKHIFCFWYISSQTAVTKCILFSFYFLCIFFCFGKFTEILFFPFLISEKGVCDYKWNQVQFKVGNGTSQASAGMSVIWTYNKELPEFGFKIRIFKKLEILFSPEADNIYRILIWHLIYLIN